MIVVSSRFSTDPDPRGPFDELPEWSDEMRLLIFGIALCQAVSASLHDNLSGASHDGSAVAEKLTVDRRGDVLTPNKVTVAKASPTAHAHILSPSQLNP